MSCHPGCPPGGINYINVLHLATQAKEYLTAILVERARLVFGRRIRLQQRIVQVLAFQRQGQELVDVVVDGSRNGADIILVNGALAIQAIQEAGRDGDVKVYGIDGESGSLDVITAGQYTATIGYPLVVKESTIAAAKLCSGEALEKRIVLDSTLINSKNVADYAGRAPQ